jgi:hypothetical protein
VLNRFNADPILQEHIGSLLARKQSLLDLDQDERPEQLEQVDPQHTLRAYMNDQYAVGPPGSLAFECALIGTISQHHAGLVPNIDKDKLRACSYRTCTAGPRSSRRFSRASSSP